MRRLVALLPALVLLVPTPAYAAGTVRHDDGTREAAVHVDSSDGSDNVSTRFVLPDGTLPGSTGARLWVYARAAECDLPAGGSHEIMLSPGYILLAYDPCALWSSTAYGWHAFDVPLDLFRDGANHLWIRDAPTRLALGLGTAAGHNAHYGIDTSSDLESTVVQNDASGTHPLAGELMWYLEFTGSMPSMRLSTTAVKFGTRTMGTTSPATTVTVHSNGLEDLLPTLTLSGAAAGDFAVVSDTCSGATVAPGTSCAFGVTFTPQAEGSRYATVTVAAPGVATASVALHGEAPTDPPVSGFTTPDGAVLLPGEAVRGVVSGASSIDHEWVEFVPDLAQEPTTRGRASLSCDALRTSCTWSVAEVRYPGRYTVTAYGADLQGNVESPGAPITVTIL